jgi:hypothetical protein
VRSAAACGDFDSSSRSPHARGSGSSAIASRTPAASDCEGDSNLASRASVVSTASPRQAISRSCARTFAASPASARAQASASARLHRWAYSVIASASPASVCADQAAPRSASARAMVCRLSASKRSANAWRAARPSHAAIAPTPVIGIAAITAPAAAKPAIHGARPRGFTARDHARRSASIEAKRRSGRIESARRSTGRSAAGIERRAPSWIRPASIAPKICGSVRPENGGVPVSTSHAVTANEN